MIRVASLSRPSLVALFAAVTSVSVVALSGCDTDAFCFADCGGGGQNAGAADHGGGGQGQFTGGSTGQFTTGGGGEGAGGPCQQTNGGTEICDQIDNDCNGTVDDIPGIDYASPTSCGTCNTNCYTQLVNMDPATITCSPSSMPGQTPGMCSGECTADYFDLDMDGQSCEYFCIKSGNNDSVCDNKDDDCDGSVDEDVDVCTDTQNCGKCGGICVAAHATPVCSNDGGMPCDETNTRCEIPVNGCEAGWIDLDGVYATGCEYNCTPSGPEVCGDQTDNDCDGLIDGADDLSGDPQIGVVCFGDPNGVCATVAHAGLTDCVDGNVACVGPNVLVEGQTPETCNNVDDDCDGTIDDSPTDAGMACGTSNNFPCTFGTMQCTGGALSCVGAINPGTETCNGQDDNCDGQIDLANGLPPMDATGACNVPPPAPPNATSPCMAGTKACVGGTVQCVGSVGPTAAQDACGVDSNCDGVLNNQPNTMTDEANCGVCGNNCNAGAVHANFGCVNGGCVFQGCQQGWFDLDNNGTCEYACTFISAQEACNGTDDNCNGQIDESVMAPSPKQVCGVSPAASAAECTTGVQVQCVNGGWQCTFPAGVCPGGCSQNDEICDLGTALDNDCDGQVNENVPDWNAPCASDDGLAVKHGACRTTGTKVCATPTTTSCSAMKANCAGLPGGCTETCDGVDNDCDGSIDETFNAKGSNTSFFVKPKVIKLASNLWTYQYEASRPNFDAVKNPTGSTNVVPGSGNGYWVANQTPPGETVDATPSCSEPNHIPWFNVTPAEVQQTCSAMGGSICSLQQWRDACHVTPAPPVNDCLWGYSPANDANCRTSYTATKFCNLGPSYDFNTMVMGDQDGLLPTGSALLQNCYSNWDGLVVGNPAQARLFDITGNLREITQLNSTTFTVMGGAFNTSAEAGATCDFTFYNVDDEFKFYDTGFRCCFTSDPTL